jgi:hypothetical protein
VIFRSSDCDEFVSQHSANISAARIPTPDEDREVAHGAFLHAFEISRPEECRIPGMQEFASAILAREKIPSQQYSDPLAHVFDEFDTDGNGALSASEVSSALQSRRVDISDDQVTMFMAALRYKEPVVKKEQFRDLIVHMAAADFQCSQLLKMEESGAEGETSTVCTFESDEDVQRTLEAWRDSLLHSGVLNETLKSVVSSSSCSSSGSEDTSSVDEHDYE